MPKLKLGEPMGAGGALNAALALKSWEGGDGGPVLVNSLSLGGTNLAAEGNGVHVFTDEDA